MSSGLLHHNFRGTLLLFVCFITLAALCGLAAMGAVLRPVRWTDRKR
ncbi:MAG: hypothetical protein U0172_07355 [Nitrospiraceae bacterium]